MDKSNSNSGNETNIEEIPYKPVPEINPPGVVINPDSNSQTDEDNFSTNDVGQEDVERARGWGEQNKL